MEKEEIYGMIGSICVIIAYVLSVYDIINNDDLLYFYLNIIGSFILFEIAYINNQLCFMILNAFWFFATFLSRF